MDILKWVKFKDKMPPEPKNLTDTIRPVMAGINSDFYGFYVAFIYWEKIGKTWKLNLGNNFKFDDISFELEDLSWFPYPLPELEIEEEA